MFNRTEPNGHVTDEPHRPNAIDPAAGDDGSVPPDAAQTQNNEQSNDPTGLTYTSESLIEKES